MRTAHILTHSVAGWLTDWLTETDSTGFRIIFRNFLVAKPTKIVVSRKWNGNVLSVGWSVDRCTYICINLWARVFDVFEFVLLFVGKNRTQWTQNIQPQANRQSSSENGLTFAVDARVRGVCVALKLWLNGKWLQREIDIELNHVRCTFLCMWPFVCFWHALCVYLLTHTHKAQRSETECPTSFQNLRTLSIRFSLLHFAHVKYHMAACTQCVWHLIIFNAAVNFKRLFPGPLK